MRKYDDIDIKRKYIAFGILMYYIIFAGCLLGFAIYFKPCEVHAETDAPQVYHDYDGK